ncbi:hypothetical protein J6590_046562 [Homalodisca vitripennis]|nr:hypothetical protein J6590_046562 [Homalodisca vitripennis]
MQRRAKFPRDHKGRTNYGPWKFRLLTAEKRNNRLLKLPSTQERLCLCTFPGVFAATPSPFMESVPSTLAVFHLPSLPVQQQRAELVLPLLSCSPSLSSQC